MKAVQLRLLCMVIAAWMAGMVWGQAYYQEGQAPKPTPYRDHIEGKEHFRQQSEFVDKGADEPQVIRDDQRITPYQDHLQEQEAETSDEAVDETVLAPAQGQRETRAQEAVQQRINTARERQQSIRKAAEERVGQIKSQAVTPADRREQALVGRVFTEEPEETQTAALAVLREMQREAEMYQNRMARLRRTRQVLEQKRNQELADRLGAMMSIETIRFAMEMNRLANTSEDAAKAFDWEKYAIDEAEIEMPGAALRQDLARLEELAGEMDISMERLGERGAAVEEPAEILPEPEEERVAAELQKEAEEIVEAEADEPAATAGEVESPPASAEENPQ